MPCRLSVDIRLSSYSHLWWIRVKYFGSIQIVPSREKTIRTHESELLNFFEEVPKLRGERYLVESHITRWSQNDTMQKNVPHIFFAKLRLHRLVLGCVPNNTSVDLVWSSFGHLREPLGKGGDWLVRSRTWYGAHKKLRNVGFPSNPCPRTLYHDPFGILVLKMFPLIQGREQACFTSSRAVNHGGSCGIRTFSYSPRLCPPPSFSSRTCSTISSMLRILPSS